MTDKAKGTKASGMPVKDVSTTGSEASLIPKMSRTPIQIPQVERIAAYGQHLFECVACVMTCKTHMKIAISKLGRDKGYWLPMAPVKPSEGWYPTMVARLKVILAVGTVGKKDHLNFSPPQVYHILRLQVPNVSKWVSRVIYTSALEQKKDKPPMQCCQQNSMVTWVDYNELITMQELWGNEPLYFLDSLINQTTEKGSYNECVLRDSVKYLPRDNPKNNYEELLKGAGLVEKDINGLYSEYVQHTYPAQFMTCHSFTEYLKKIKWPATKEEMASIFRSFLITSTNTITFHEFLMGLAAMEKKTPHEGNIGQLRILYIFRYYDANGDKNLDITELRALLIDLYKIKGTQIDEADLDNQLGTCYKSMSLNIGDAVNEMYLLRSIKSGLAALKGTSQLLRNPGNIMTQVGLKGVYDSVTDLQFIGIDDGRKKLTACPRCKLKKYTLACHSAKLTQENIITEPVDIQQEDSNNPSKLKRQLSDLILSESDPNRMIDMIRQFNESLFGASKNAGTTNWANGDRNILSKLVLHICAEAEKIFKKEQRCVRVSCPAYVFGDIHGNMHDLMIYEKMLWSKGPSVLSASYLFLGDYVDRGDHGLECVMYLFSMKILAPEKFFLLRGNHELRPIQQTFTFSTEICNKFIDAGKNIWETVNKVFDCMPICAVVDDSIFCAHGGIPMSATKLEELNNIPAPLPDPESVSQAAWEMLWNDPVNPTEFQEYKELVIKQSVPVTAYIPNTKRGTAYYFSEEAVNKFLKNNGLTHIIRAHEVVPPGYGFHLGGKVITIFSSSKYCNGTNEAACVFISEEKLRIMKLDTN